MRARPVSLCGRCSRTRTPGKRVTPPLMEMGGAACAGEERNLQVLSCRHLVGDVPIGRATAVCFWKRVGDGKREAQTR